MAISIRSVSDRSLTDTEMRGTEKDRMSQSRLRTLTRTNMAVSVFLANRTRAARTEKISNAASDSHGLPADLCHGGQKYQY